MQVLAAAATPATAALAAGEAVAPAATAASAAAAAATGAAALTVGACAYGCVQGVRIVSLRVGKDPRESVSSPGECGVLCEAFKDWGVGDTLIVTGSKTNEKELKRNKKN